MSTTEARPGKSARVHGGLMRRRGRARMAGFLRGPTGSPVWERPALLALLGLTTLLYTWGLDRNGWANSYYSAAAMSGSLDWTAFLFGSSDPGNAITVDKPPLSIWVMSLSVRVFGLSSWSLLLPQSLMGVASVYLLYRMVRKRIDAATGLLAGVLFAVTPVATVMFRYNNPDALLTLVMLGIAACTLESIDRARLRWLLLAGVLTGAGFLTKQLQVLFILPSVALAYLLFAHTSVVKRFLHLVGALAVATTTCGWWLLVVQLTNPSSRPFIGGSRSNSVIELTLGYNGLDRLTGAAGRTAVAGASGAGEEFEAGFQRFLQPQFSGQSGWFLPLAVAGLCLAFWCLWRRREEPAQRAFLLLSCLWFISSTTVLAFMSGIVHPYYVLNAVPAISCLAAVAVVHFLRRLHDGRVRAFAAVTLTASMTFAYLSTARSTAEFPILPQAMLILGGIIIGLVFVKAPTPAMGKVIRTLVICTLLLGPAVWSLNTVANSHTGASVIAGPGILSPRADDRERASPDLDPGLAAVIFGDVPSPEVLNRLSRMPVSTTWVTAVFGSETAANYQLEAGRAVLPVGGFDGGDPFPTLEQFQVLVREGRVGSVVIQNLPPLTLDGQGESARIVEWVRGHFLAEQVAGGDYYQFGN